MSIVGWIIFRHSPTLLTKIILLILDILKILIQATDAMLLPKKAASD